jgi:nucleoside recognition membrane protein YjiH
MSTVATVASEKNKVENKVKNKPLAVAKFFLFSLIGITAFFVQVPLGGTRKLFMDHLTSFLYGIFAPGYYYLVLAFCAFALIQTFITRKTYRRSGLDFVLAVCKTLGTVIVILLLSGAAPRFIANENIGPATVVNMGRSIIMIFCAAFFLPFLINYGLIDAVGVIVKPFMRPVFKVPGLTAVVAAGTFLGNFSIGILSTNSLYKEGKLNYRESAIVVTGFSTISIGLMLLFSQLLKITDYFLFYFISSAIVTYIVTAITIRIPPIRIMPETCYEGKPNPIAEDTLQGSRLKGAWDIGLAIADAAPSPVKTVGGILLSTLRVLADMISSSMFIIVLGLALNQYTPVFSWLGMIFYPVYALFGIPDAPVMSAASGLAIMDVIPAVMFGSSQNLSLAARYVLAAFPVTVIIFIGGFFTCLMATDFRVKVRHLFILWVERMLLALIFYCAIAALFFR